MNRGSQAYLRHFFGVFAAMALGMLLAVLDMPLVPALLMVGALAYAVALTVGYVLRLGPFSYVGRLFTQDAGAEPRRKQPWE